MHNYAHDQPQQLSRYISLKSVSKATAFFISHPVTGHYGTHS